MHPELLTLPGGLSIKTYGFFMMLGFLASVWTAMRRATRVKADPDLVLDIALVSLVFGIGGARLFYVVHYWKSQFADAPNPLFAIINITSGGLEFLGGFLGAVLATTIHAWWKKYSLRLYLDITAPSAMLGLVFGRLGCFFNGCCFGAIAATSAPHPVENRAATVRERTDNVVDSRSVGTDGSPPIILANQKLESSAAETTAHRDPAGSLPWAVRFPYGSPAHVRHWEQRRVTVPAELVATPKESLQTYLVPEQQLFMSVEKRQGMELEVRDLERAYKAIKDQDSAEAKKLHREWKDANKKVTSELALLNAAQSFPSCANPKRDTSVSELEALAHQCRSLPVHPAQLYAAIGALLLSLFVSAIFYRRKRHGMVIGMVLLLYPVQRTFEEIIRADNPQDVAGLTVSQSISLGLLVLAIAYLVVLYKYMPERSPLAVFTPRPEPTT